MEFIAVFLVVVLMIVFLVVAITRMKNQVGKQIEKDIDQLVNVYDKLLDEKSQKLHELERKIEELENYEIPVQDVLSDSEDLGYVIIQGGQYVEGDFFKNYALVKSSFHDLSYQAMVETVDRLKHVRRDVNVHEYKELLETFDYELQYQMNTLDNKDQLEIIELIIQHSMGKRRILKRFLDSHDVFSFEVFMDFIRNYIFYHDSLIYVYSYSGEKCIENAPTNIDFMPDSSIGEGFVVRFRDKRYDFSLKGGFYE